MRHILVLYGTTDGHTRKVARFVGDALRSLGAHVDVVNAADGFALMPDRYDGTIVTASVHVGRYQRAVRRWVHEHREALNARPSAFLSVCLGVLQHETKADRDLADIVARFTASTGWRPGITKLVAGAMPFTRYNWLKRWVMVRIARKAHGDTDTSHDVEYTDWSDLRTFAGEFYLRIFKATGSALLAS